MSFLAFLSSYAGPLATIVASFSAVCVTGYFAWQQKNIAASQRDISRDKLRLDLFERRYRTIEAAFDYRRFLYDESVRMSDLLGGVKGGLKIKETRNANFVKAAIESSYLFGDDIASLFKKLHEDGWQFLDVVRTIESGLFEEGEHETLLEKRDQILDEDIPADLVRLSELASPYLDFTRP